MISVNTMKVVLMFVWPLQENVHSLQTAVGSLQKEKEELIHALQSAKKDTNQAK